MQRWGDPPGRPGLLFHFELSGRFLHRSVMNGNGTDIVIERFFLLLRLCTAPHYSKLGISMIRPAFFAIAALAVATLPALAQQSPDQPKTPAATTSPEPSGMPKNPDLTVATVKVQGGFRVSKLIGSAVYNDQNEKVGSLDDLIMKGDNQIVMGVVSVGGFLGMGNKLVAVPYDTLHLEADKDKTKIMLPGASKDSLNAMPTFTYDG
jgi:hypothetical protein